MKEEDWSKKAETYGQANDFEESNRQFVIDFFRDKEGKLIEFCCGNGKILTRITNQNLELTGLDYCSEMLNQIKNKRIATVRCRCSNVPFRNNSFDYSICINSTHNLKPDEFLKTLREMSKVTSKLMLIEFRNKKHFPLAFGYLVNRKKNLFFYPYNLKYIKRCIANLTDFEIVDIIKTKYPLTSNVLYRTYIKYYTNPSYILILKRK